MADAAVQAEAQALLERGAGLYEAGKLYEALACWKQVLDLDPGNEIATEYLRFIEDNFQIGVDAFMAQHQAVTAPPPPPPPVSRPPQGLADEALGDLDWSEILEDPDQGSLPPAGSTPVPVTDLEEDDEDFFSELEPGSINALPGDEATAWSADSSRPSEAPAAPAFTPPPMEADPLAMDVSAFSAPVAAPVRADSVPPGGAGTPPSREDRDLAQMSDDSIEVMLDQDFKAWEEEDLTQTEHSLDSADGAPATDDDVPSRITQVGAPTPARPTHGATQDEDADFFARPFEHATEPPLPAPQPDDSLEIGTPPPSPPPIPGPALRTPPGRAEALRTPPPAQISAPPPDPEEVPFDMARDEPPADSVEIPLDGLLEQAEAEERIEAHTTPDTGEDPFAALEEAFSSLSTEMNDAERAFDDLQEAVAPSRPPIGVPPESVVTPGGEPINFDESVPVRPAGPPADAVEYLEDADHALPDVDFAMVEASVAEGDPAPPFAEPDDDDPLPDFELDEPLAAPDFDLGEDEGPVDFDLDDDVDFNIGGDDPGPVDFELDDVDFVLEDEEPPPLSSPAQPATVSEVPDFDLGMAPTLASPSTPPPAPELPPHVEAPAPPPVQMPPRAEISPAEHATPGAGISSQTGGAAPAGIEALLRQGLAEIEAVESGAETPDQGGIRRLIKAPPPDTDFDQLMVDARRRQQAGDFTGSLELVEQVLAGKPDHTEAQAYLKENTTRLLAMYRSRLGKLSKVPKLKLRPQEIIWQSLDHRAGFVLAQVDGMTSYEDIIEIASMPELEATRILARLVDHGVIG